ncbi:TPA: hypothetical protein RL799_003300 [Escherichia coli]|nr:hypothetical protein [Escherichia coli]
MRRVPEVTSGRTLSQALCDKPLAARQALTRSEAVLQKSLDITEEADLALRNAMARIK